MTEARHLHEEVAFDMPENNETEPAYGLAEPDADNLQDVFEDARETSDLDMPAPSEDLVKVYLKQIGKVALLDAAQEVELAKKIEVGVYADHVRTQKFGNESDLEKLSEQERQLYRDLGFIVRDGEKAKDAMIEANLRLVVSIAKRYKGLDVPLLDLIQEGNAGLIRAVEKFDYQKGYKFSTYATWWIRQAITRTMSDQGRMIRLPVHVHEEVVKIDKTKRELLAQLGRSATLEELAHATGYKEDRVRFLLDASKDPVSFSAKIGSEEDAELGDFIQEDTENAVEVGAEIMLERLELERAIGTLKERQQQVIRMRYGLGCEPHTLDQIGKVIGVTRERVRQIEAAATNALRDPIRSRRLRRPEWTPKVDGK